MAPPLSASARFLIAKDVTQKQAAFLERVERPELSEAGGVMVKAPRYGVTVLALTSGAK
jgi:hypothetical protein